MNSTTDTVGFPRAGQGQRREDGTRWPRGRRGAPGRSGCAARDSRLRQRQDLLTMGLGLHNSIHSLQQGGTVTRPCPTLPTGRRLQRCSDPGLAQTSAAGTACLAGSSLLDLSKPAGRFFLPPSPALSVFSRTELPEDCGITGSSTRECRHYLFWMPQQIFAAFPF